MIPFALVSSLCAASGDGYALIIGNNDSFGLHRPSLQYADDDAAKYAEVFEGLLPVGHVTVLTALDRDSERLFPRLSQVVRPPSRAEVERAVLEIAGAVRASKKNGAAVTFYFVFAGHGDTEQGRGFLELSDGPMTSDDLERHLGAIAATETHVILDSCNSFFVINPRKAGGRRFATPKDAAERLSKHFPNVGVFLSTSAEGEVYEWSELQSGVFSHAVRSGLSGAADADLDGTVSYLELAAFVETASSRIPNPNFRPKVFARGPAGDDGRTLVRLSSEKAVILEAGGDQAVRLTLRSAEGVRWLDAHVEPGARVRLHVPTQIADGMTAEQPLDGGVRVATLVTHGTVSWETMQTQQGSRRSRGLAEVFETLFSSPFGPARLSDYVTERSQTPEPVFGISKEDSERMNMLLGQLAQTDRARRYLNFGTMAAFTGALGIAAAHGFQTDRSVGWVLVGAALGSAAFGTYLLLSGSDGERLHAGFNQRYRLLETDPGPLVAETERRLVEIVEQEQRERRFAEVAGWIFACLGTVNILGLQLGPIVDTRVRFDESFRFGAGVVSAGLLFVGVSFILYARLAESALASIIQVWSEDPAMRRLPRVTAAVTPQGAWVGLSGDL